MISAVRQITQVDLEFSTLMLRVHTTPDHSDKGLSLLMVDSSELEALSVGSDETDETDPRETDHQVIVYGSLENFRDLAEAITEALQKADGLAVGIN